MIGSTQSPALDGESLFPLTTVYSINWEGEGPGVGLRGCRRASLPGRDTPHSYNSG